MQAILSSQLYRANGGVYQPLHRHVLQDYTFFFSPYIFVCFLLTTYNFLLLSDLSRKIMRGIALALGGSPNEFEGDRAGNAFWVMRIIGYPGVPTSNGHGPRNDIGW